MAKRKPAAALEEDLKRTEKRWLAADAAVWQSYEVMRCAKERMGNGQEGEAWNLFDAALTVLSSYTETEQD